MATQFTIQQKEFIEAHRAACRKLPRARKWMGWLVYFLFFVGLGICLWATNSEHSDNPDLQKVGWMMFVWAWTLVATLIFSNRYALRRQYKERFSAVELSFDYDDTTVFANTSRGSESRTPWHIFQGWVETPSTLVLLQDTFIFNIVPKRVLTAEALNSLRATLQNKIS